MSMRSMFRSLSFVSVLSAAPLLAHAGPGDASKPAAARVDDAQIAGFLAAADKGEIDASKLATGSRNAAVKELASHMVAEHTRNTAEAKKVFAAAAIKPAEGEDSRALTADARRSLDKLRGLKGAELDRAYVDDQVAMHTRVLDTVDKKLLPAASHPAVRSFLEELRPKLVAHLEHAKKVQTSLGSAAR